jgi:hypothetical protein
VEIYFRFRKKKKRIQDLLCYVCCFCSLAVRKPIPSVSDGALQCLVTATDGPPADMPSGSTGRKKYDSTTGLAMSRGSPEI